MGHAPKATVETRHRLHPGANFVMGREQVFSGILIGELRFVGQDRGELALKLFADVDDKRGTNVVVKRGVNDLEGTMRRKGSSAGVPPAVQGASHPQF